MKHTVKKEPEEIQTNESSAKKTANWKKIGITTGISAASIMLCVICLGVMMTFAQNKKVLDLAQSSSGTDIHTIYDDTAVIEANKSGDESKLDLQDKYVLKAAKGIIASNIKKGMTDYEKELAIYEWLVKYVAYDNSSLVPVSTDNEYSHLPYGVLKYHSAICVGNATTFKLFMDMLGIDCKIIHSTTSGEHAWNMVKIDGDWYHVDTFFDGGSNGNVNYSYFNVPDSMKENGGYPWERSEFPAATATKYCYIYNNSKTANTIYDVPAVIQKAKKNKTTIIYFELKNSKDITYDIMNYTCTNMSDIKNTVMYNQSFALAGKVICQVNIDSSAGAENKKIDFKKLKEKISKALGKNIKEILDYNPQNMGF